MKAIWKFPLELKKEQQVMMPHHAQILTAQVQHQQICLWAKVDPESPKEPRVVLILGTGHDVSDSEIFGFHYIDTVQTGSYVWYVFFLPY